MVNSFWNKLGLRCFVVNDRETLKPNLWCLCSAGLSPSVLEVASQYIAFSITVNSKISYFATVYGSASNVKRCVLWAKLSSTSLILLPWAVDVCRRF